MSDDPSEPPRPVAAAPLLPEEVNIPVQLLEAWFAIRPEHYLDVRLTRGDLDRFYATLNKSLVAQSTFQQSMVEYTNGRSDEANVGLHTAKRLLIEAQNDLRQLMTAVMASATRGSANGR